MFSLSIRNASASTVIATFFFKPRDLRVRLCAQLTARAHCWHLIFAPVRARTRASPMICFFVYFSVLLLLLLFSYASPLSAVCWASIGILSDNGLGAMTLLLYIGCNEFGLTKTKCKIQKMKRATKWKLMRGFSTKSNSYSNCHYIVTGQVFFLSSIHPSHFGPFAIVNAWKWNKKKKTQNVLSVIHFGINNWKSNCPYRCECTARDCDFEWKKESRALPL